VRGKRRKDKREGKKKNEEKNEGKRKIKWAKKKEIEGKRNKQGKVKKKE